MSLTQLKDQAAHLPFKEQRELIAYLISLQTEKDGRFRDQLSQKIDDKDASNWLELDELHKRYSD